MERIKNYLADVNKRKVIIQVIISFILTALGYNSLEPQDLTTWAGLGDLFVGVLFNPYLLGLCIYNAYNALSNPKKQNKEE